MGKVSCTEAICNTEMDRDWVNPWVGSVGFG